MTDVLYGSAVVAISFNEGELWAIFRDWCFINHYYSCPQKILYHMSQSTCVLSPITQRVCKASRKRAKKLGKRCVYTEDLVTSHPSWVASLLWTILGEKPSSELTYSIFKVKWELGSHQSLWLEPWLWAEEAGCIFPCCLVLSLLTWSICMTVSSLTKVRDFSPQRSLNTTLFWPCNTRTFNGAKCRGSRALCARTSSSLHVERVSDKRHEQ